MKSTTNSQNHFANIENPNVQRSVFDRSSGFKADFDSGKLIPFFFDAAVPGDTFKGEAHLFGRLNTPIKPIMDNIYIDVHYFSVPHRLVWDNFKRFMGERPDPDSSVDFLMPTIDLTARNFAPYSNGDYLGLPTSINNITGITALPFRAIHLIWNEWYRDQNLQNSLPVLKTDGPDSSELYATLLPRGKRKDYFTSALTEPQKGNPVQLPLGDSAPIVGTSTITRVSNATPWDVYRTGTNAKEGSAGPLAVNATGGITINGLNNYSLDPNGGLQLNTSGLSANLAEATAITINQLRQAFQFQRMLERDNRGGTRYTELIRSHFGVTSPDARLQRPEYLGGGTLNVNVNPIAQTAPTSDGATPQGNLAAMGTFKSNGGIRFHKSFTEHEYIIGFLSARADLNYQQGVNREWLRSTRNDFYWPTYAHLGEQGIYNKEIYAQGTSEDNEIFGYQERYAEMRYKPGYVAGAFRSNYAQSLDVWHLSQDFAELPSLNGGFIEENPPIKRIVAVPSEKDFLVDIFTSLHCTRPLPTYGTPGLIDHF